MPSWLQRHSKPGLTAFATIILLVTMEPISYLAGAAVSARWCTGHFAPYECNWWFTPSEACWYCSWRQFLSVFKPWGMAPYGRPNQR